jgi:methanogenic corrinoid protein MtbC1
MGKNYIFNYKEMFTNLIDALTRPDADRSTEEVAKLLDAGVDPFEIIENGLMQAMDIVGSRFEEATFFLPELLLAAKAVEACSALIRPLLAAEPQRARGTIVVGTVAGDIHDLGKNLIISTFESAGFRVIDLGVDVPLETFVESVRREKARILAMSAVSEPIPTRLPPCAGRRPLMIRSHGLFGPLPAMDSALRKAFDRHCQKANQSKTQHSLLRLLL